MESLNTQLVAARARREAYEGAHHVHGIERWFGMVSPQTATDWGDEASLIPYTAISGNNAFGSDADDEAQCLGTDDTPSVADNTAFDLHRIFVASSSNDEDWVLRIVYGTSTMAAAESAGQYSDVFVNNIKKGGPIEVMMPQLAVATKVWIRAKNFIDNAEIDFFVGMHEYPEASLD